MARGDFNRPISETIVSERRAWYNECVSSRPGRRFNNLEVDVTTQQPKEPTVHFVQKHIEAIERDSQFSSEHEALSKLLAAFPSNQHLEDVILKVAAINSIYNTHIFGIYRVAQHICKLQIDAQLERKSPEIVDKIAPVTFDNGKQIRFYSFATKYCSWHKPDAYPRYDGVVGRLLVSYQMSYGFEKFIRSDLSHYVRYKEIVERFRDYYDLTQFNFNKLDNFLWAYGRELEA